jgi:hypothetical protein
VTAFRQHSAVMSTALGDDVVVLQLATQRYYTLNVTAAHAWKELADGADVEELADALARQFDIGIEEAREHADALLRRLVGLGLVEPCEPAVSTSGLPG